MTIPESLVVSAMGFSIVFCVLIFLALVILVFSKVFPALAGKGGKQPAPQAAAPAPVVEDKSETIAIVTSVICEELNADPNELTIRGIREL